jgi:hypothetical protein
MKKFYFISTIVTMVLMTISLVGMLFAYNTLDYVYMFNIVSILCLVSIFKYEKKCKMYVLNPKLA